MNYVPIPGLSQSDLERFRSFISVVPGNCWEWTGGKANGYGHFYLQGKTYKAHRVAFFLDTHHDPQELEVCHMCDNPPCCNPSHLFLGTSEDNKHDSVNKGRHAHGAKHGMARLSEDDVIAIKTAKDVSTVELARRYGVEDHIIGRIQMGLLWPTVLPELSRKSKRPHLTEQQVKAIRVSQERGRIIAQEFGISEATVSLIRNRKLWKQYA